MAGASVLTAPEKLWINRQFRRLMETAALHLRPIHNDFNILDLEGSGGSLPPADTAGEVLFSVDGLTFTAQLPMTAPDAGEGWLVNDVGLMLVVG